MRTKHREHLTKPMCWATAVVCALVWCRSAAAVDLNNLLDLALQLNQATEGCYRETAQDVLGLEGEDFAVVLDLLRADGPVSTGNLVAEALEYRRGHPADAAAFDEHLRAAESQRIWVSCGVGHLYQGWWPEDQPELGVLAAEVVLKHTTLTPLLPWFRFMVQFRSTKASLHRNLALAWHDGVAWCAPLGMSSLHLSQEEKSDLTPQLVQLHVYWREHGRIPFAPVAVLARWNGPEQVDALRAIQSFEADYCARRGVNPWLGDEPLEGEGLLNRRLDPERSLPPGDLREEQRCTALLWADLRRALPPPNVPK